MIPTPYTDTIVDTDKIVLSALENQLRRLSHYQIIHLPSWFAD